MYINAQYINTTPNLTIFLMIQTIKAPINKYTVVIESTNLPIKPSMILIELFATETGMKRPLSQISL